MKYIYLITVFAALLGCALYLSKPEQLAEADTKKSMQTYKRMNKTLSTSASYKTQSSQPYVSYKEDLDLFQKTAVIDQQELILVNDPDNPEEVLDEVRLFAKSNQPEAQAIAHLHTILNSLRVLHRGIYPVTGDNVEITNCLLGMNQRKQGLLPQSHPRINNEGELIDKYGTPYDFHFHSSKNVFIRSFGPDQIAYTADDIVLNNRGETEDLYNAHEAEQAAIQAQYYHGDPTHGAQSE